MPCKIKNIIHTTIRFLNKSFVTIVVFKSGFSPNPTVRSFPSLYIFFANRSDLSFLNSLPLRLSPACVSSQFNINFLPNFKIFYVHLLSTSHLIFFADFHNEKSAMYYLKNKIYCAPNNAVHNISLPYHRKAHSGHICMSYSLPHTVPEPLTFCCYPECSVYTPGIQKYILLSVLPFRILPLFSIYNLTYIFRYFMYFTYHLIINPYT